MLPTFTVLVIDDEPHVRHLVRRIVESDPRCSVIEADNAEVALHAIAGDNPPVDLVLTDLVMPGLNGIAVLGALRGHRPDLPVLAISGAEPDEQVRQRLQQYGTAVIEKPFSAEVPGSAVAAALERRASLEEAARVRGESQRIQAESKQVRLTAGALLAAARQLQRELFGS
jgi:DNA-binding NtrC family response regulator